MTKKFFHILLIIFLMLSFVACSAISSKNSRVIPFGRDVPELYSEMNDESEEHDESEADIPDPSSFLGEGDGVIGGLSGILGGSLAIYLI